MKNNILYIAVFITLLITSCREKIDINLNNEEFSRMVVEGTITDENIQQTIKLTKTSDFIKPQPPIPASGAVVSVTDGTSTFLFSEVSPGIYKSNDILKGEVGKSYSLNIQYEDKEYTASSEMYPAFVADSLYALYEKEFETYSLYINAQESPVPKQCYLVKTVKNGIVNDTLENWSYFSDELVNGIYLYNFLISFVEAVPGDSVGIIIYSISKDNLEFIKNAVQSQFEPIPFIGSSPANIKGNISNGAMGFFQVSAVSRKSCVVP